MDAMFVFKRTVGKHESQQKIAGTLKIAVHSLPSIKIDGEGKANISESLKKMIEGIEVKFHFCCLCLFVSLFFNSTLSFGFSKFPSFLHDPTVLFTVTKIISRLSCKLCHII